MIAGTRGPRCCDNGIAGYGNTTPYGVFLVGIAPAHDEMRVGRPMIGPSGKLIDGILKATGWQRELCYATNIVCHETRDPTFEQIMQCRPRLLREVQEYKPSLLVLLGNTVGELFFPNRKYGTVRGSIDYYAPWNVYVLPTYHPAAILHGAEENITRSIMRDFAKILMFFDSMHPAQPDVKFEVIQDVGRAQRVLDDLRGVPDYVALDVETHLDKDADGSIPIEERLICFSISTGACTYWFPGSLAAELQWHADINWTFHNGMFDTVALQEAIGVLLPIKHDTLYMSYALDERGGVHKLKTLAREYEQAGFYEEHPVLSKWEDKVRDVPWLQEYNARDAAYTARLATRLHARMVDDDVLDVYTGLLLPAANTYRLMQQYGMYLNKERLHSLLKQWVPLRESKDLALRAEIARLGGDPYINLSSPKQLSHFLYSVLRLPGGPSTAAPIIEALAGEHPFIKMLLDLRHLDKAMNTYLVGAWDDIMRTGRIHPTPMQHGTVGGRCSYSPYAINTLPRSTSDSEYLSKIRWLFTAPDLDTDLIEVDYSQAEIWTAYAYCRDPHMLHDLQSGDFHTANACFIYGVSETRVSSEQRSTAKRTTFGKFYGIGIHKLAGQTNKTPAEAAEFSQAWDMRYPGYKAYCNDVWNEAVKTGEIVTLTKRKRRYPIIIDEGVRNQIINFKIQSTAHDALLLAIIKAYPVVDAMGGHILIDNHDAMLIEAPKKVSHDVARRVRDIMSAEPIIPGMPAIPSEAKIGYSWAELQKVKD